MARRALDLMQGTVDILILRTLAWEPMHGYAMAQFVRARTGARSRSRAPRSIRRSTGWRRRSS